MPLIVIIEDEPDILELLGYTLRREGFDVMTSSSGETGLNLVRKQKPDLILLDLMLPQKNGLEVCRELKASANTRHIPIIMVTAKSEESDIVLGLGMNADDYVCKPFSPRELVARVRTVLRRNNPLKPTELSDRIEQDDLIIDASKHRVTYHGEEVKLTATEFRILFYLANHPGRVFSREQLLNHAVGDNIVVVDRNIDVHIRAIRKKLSEKSQSGDTEFVETIRGVGYRFKDPVVV
jgi:phosphate regulon transcriptional regulator PhoB